MNTVNYEDCYYTAMRQVMKISRKKLDDLLRSGVYRSHRDFADRSLIEDNAESAATCDAKAFGYEFGKRKDDISRQCDIYIEKALKEGIFTISREDPDYPYNWRCVRGMPDVVFAKGVRGMFSRCDSCGCVSIVGSREASRYAVYAAEKFADKLSSENVVIASGMAAGTDRAAHEASVYNRGGTIAFLAGGVDDIYPESNRDIYEKIAGRGLIVSEMPPGTRAVRQYFPSRNRLIAGIGDVCLIMQAGATSGTLHTASFAAGQGKDVFVLPNNIFSEDCRGSNLLLADGAVPLVNSSMVEDAVITALMNRKVKDIGTCGLMPKPRPSASDLRRKAESEPDRMSDNDWKTVIIDELKLKPRSMDELCALFGLSLSLATRLMITLESESKVTVSDGKYILTIV
ncbi:MAG: DNA-protecting protein DprA [Clostridiales bacterium]|nr:DNA-protecting protein DprA [Clostridiales bacterium]